MLNVGIIEGMAEATASITKVFSGALRDWLGKRKFLATLGYGLAAFTKPILSAGILDRLADRGPFHRSRWQGYPRSAPRPRCRAEGLIQTAQDAQQLPYVT